MIVNLTKFIHSYSLKAIDAYNLLIHFYLFLLQVSPMAALLSPITALYSHVSSTKEKILPRHLSENHPPIILHIRVIDTMQH